MTETRKINARPIEMQSVFEAFSPELASVEERMRGLFDSESTALRAIGSYIFESGGKRLRPLFHLASARLAGYKGEDHIHFGALFEVIHTASLLHDDVVDGADKRRGRDTAHSRWGNHIVILVGDYLYSNAVKRIAAYHNQEITDSVAEATNKMTEGEILQLERTGSADITEEEYLRIISSKTGVLISAACRVGGILAGRPKAEVEALAAYGLKAGAAFQMADDILDYMADEKDLGKKLGKDLDEGKVTLPMILLLRELKGEKRREAVSVIEKGLTDGGLGRITAMFESFGILKEAASRAKSLVEQAKAELAVFPESAERDYLCGIADYSLQRKK